MKYRNVKSDGYHSKKEAKRASELKLLQHAGVITNLQEQVKYELIPSQNKGDGTKERPVTYVADFVYEENGVIVVEDVKGMRLPEYVIKRKLMLWVRDITIRET